jgi:hypothetical protein
MWYIEGKWHNSNKASYYIYLHILGLFNPLNAQLNPICHLLALLAHPILHVSRIRVNNAVSSWDYTVSDCRMINEFRRTFRDMVMAWCEVLPCTSLDGLRKTRESCNKDGMSLGQDLNMQVLKYKVEMSLTWWHLVDNKYKESKCYRWTGTHHGFLESAYHCIPLALVNRPKTFVSSKGYHYQHSYQQNCYTTGKEHWEVH